MARKFKSKGKKVSKWVECMKPRFPPFHDCCTMDSKLVEEAKCILQTGSDLWKVKGMNSWYPRRYIFDPELHRIKYEGSRKFPCFDSNTVIDLQKIHDVRKGWRTDIFNKIARQMELERRRRPESEFLVREECCFSIVYGARHRSLDLVCPNETICNAWVRGLTYWIATQRNAQCDQAVQSWLKNQFRRADVDSSGALNFNECLILLNQLNINMTGFHARRIFDEADTLKIKRNGEDVIDENEFVTFYRLLIKRPELEALFFKYSAGAPMMSSNQLITFLKEEQKVEDITIDDTIDIINMFEPDETRIDGFLSQEGFRKMLLAAPMDIFNISHRSLYQDMNQPLSHYYIASSHNTLVI